MRKIKNEELKRLSVHEFKKAGKIPVVVVLDNVRSTHNIGSVFRTADAFRIERIVLCGITATPPNKDIRKTALGATESVDWMYTGSTNEAIQTLKNGGYRIFAVEQADESIPLHALKFRPEDKLVLVFGHEVLGVQEEVIRMVDGCIEIPQFGTKHSLNISVSAGIVLWEVCKRYNWNADNAD